MHFELSRTSAGSSRRPSPASSRPRSAARGCRARRPGAAIRSPRCARRSGSCRVLGEQQLHHGAPRFTHALRIGADLHALADRKRTGGREGFRALHLHQADPACAERLEPFEKAERGNGMPAFFAAIRSWSRPGRYGNGIYSTGRHYALLSALNGFSIIATQAAFRLTEGNTLGPALLHLVEVVTSPVDGDHWRLFARKRHWIGIRIELVCTSLFFARRHSTPGKIGVDADGRVFAGGDGFDHRGRPGHRVAAGENPRYRGRSGGAVDRQRFPCGQCKRFRRKYLGFPRAGRWRTMIWSHA